MYTIYADDKLLYAPHLFNEGYGVFSPKLTVELGKAGSLEFTMPPSNVKYDELKKLNTVITALQDKELLFRGRVLHEDKDFYKQKKAYCEGDMSFLLDSNQRPYTYEGDARTVLAKYISAHNARVDSAKQFVVGNVTAASGKTLYCSNAEYAQTLDEMNTQLIDVYGGYFQTRTVGNTHYIDWLSQAHNSSMQTIEFGVNLLDLSEYITAEDIFTVIIPIGASKQDEEGNDLGKVDITSVNNGKDYIENATAISLFGRIEKKVDWSDVEDPNELKTLGTNLLNSSVEMAVSLSVKAVDLSLLGADVDKISVGDMVRVISLPHGLDKEFQCTKIVYDLENPDRNDYTFGVSFTSLTDQQVSSSKKVAGSYSLVQSAVTAATHSASVANQASKNVEQVITKIDTEYVKTETFNTYKEEVDDRFENISIPDGDYVEIETFNTYKTEVNNRFENLPTIDPAEPLIVGDRVLGCLSYENTGSKDEFVIKTKIPFSPSNGGTASEGMPMLHVVGGAYGTQKIIDFTVYWYVYTSIFYYAVYRNNGSWNPQHVYLSTYTEGGTKYVALSIKLGAALYWIDFTVDAYVGKLSTRYAESAFKGWSVDAANVSSGESSVIPQIDIIKVKNSLDVKPERQRLGIGTAVTVPAGGSKTITLPGASTFLVSACDNIRKGCIIVQTTNVGIGTPTTLVPLNSWGYSSSPSSFNLTLTETDGRYAVNISITSLSGDQLPFTDGIYTIT